MSIFLQVATTCETQDEANQLAAALVGRRLAACVQVQGPIQSTYRWEGVVQSSAEWLCTMKTTATRFDSLRSAILELHSYDVPEVVATEIIDGSGAYLEWLAAEVAEVKE